MKINTKKLQTLVSKALKGAGLNKLIPITSLVAIEQVDVLDKSAVCLTTTDANNYLYLYEPDVEIEKDFYAVVEVGQFASLISKLTCEKVLLEVTNSSLHIIGNGQYDIPLQFDENGSIVEYPEPTKNVVWDETEVFKLSTVLDSLNYCKSSLAVTMEEPVYTNYFVGDGVIATDITKISKISGSVFEEPRLISSATMDLLGIMQNEKISILSNEENSYIGFKTPDITIISSVVKGIEDYQIDAITGLLDQEYPNSCKVDKKVLFETIDRISLFITAYDNNGVKLIFSGNELRIESMNDAGTETIPMQGSNNSGFSCIVPSEALLNILKVMPDGLVEIQYGEPNAIKLIKDGLVQVIALLED